MDPAQKERLGKKWACYSCGVRFYDLKKPDPICPKCEADQRESPVFEKPKRARKKAKKKATKKVAKKVAKKKPAKQAGSKAVPPPDGIDPDEEGPPDLEATEISPADAADLRVEAD